MNYRCYKDTFSMVRKKEALSTETTSDDKYSIEYKTWPSFFNQIDL